MPTFERIIVSSGVTSSLTGGSYTNLEVYAGAGAAAEVLEGGTLNANGAIFQNNSAVGRGGAITNSGALNFSSTTFSGNYANYSGGAIRNASGSVIISGGGFYGNGAGSVGGAIYNHDEATITSVTFSGNNANHGAGALYNDSGTLTISDAIFNENRTGAKRAVGGAIVNYFGTVNVFGGSFEGNSATADDAGAIYNSQGMLNISGATFTSNGAYTRGGAICNISGKMTVSGGSFCGNNAINAGGAIYNGKRAASLDINGASFEGNSASSGGAIYNYLSATLDINDGSFAGNSASFGGAINNGVGTTLNISGAIFSDNLAYSGGAIYNKGTAIVSGADFIGNDAGMGAAIYNNKGTVDILGTMDILGGNFKGNSAVTGGAILNADAMTISGGNFNNNSASNGGAIYNTSGSVDIAGANFSGNVASDNGGAIYNDGGTMTLKDVSFLTSTDTIYNTGTMTFQGTISLAGTVTTTGTITATGANIVFDLTSYVGSLDTALLDYSKIDGADYSVSINSEQLGDYTLASNAATAAGTPITVNVVGASDPFSLTVNGDGETYEGKNYRLNTDSNYALVLTVREPELVPYSITDSIDTTYDGQAHGITVTVGELLSVPTIYYSIDGTQTWWEEGSSYSLTNATEKTTTVYFKIEAKGYVTTVTEARTIDIAKKGLSVLGTTVEGKIYDGTAAADITAGTLDGVVEGEESGVQVSASGAFDDQNAGTGKSVMVNYQLSGDKAGNYELVSEAEELEANITQREVYVTGTAVDGKEYDGTTDASAQVGTLQNTVQGDDISVHVSSADFGDKNAGTDKDVTVEYMLSGDAAGNYYLKEDTQTLQADITQKELTVLPTCKNYDGNTDVSLNIANKLEGDDVELIGTLDGAEVGTHTVTPTGLSGNDADNYSVSPAGSLSVYVRAYVKDQETYDLGAGTYTNPIIWSGNGAAGEVCSGGTLNTDGANFVNNSATGNGGAVYNDGMLNISGGSFDGNGAKEVGGAIFNDYHGAAFISGVIFSGNTAVSGGAIANRGTLDIAGGSFVGNSSPQGGAISNTGLTTISDVSFVGNSGEVGGAICNADTVDISGADFSGNSAEMGGAIYNCASANISGGSFVDNSATVYGGAIYNDYGEMTISGATFIGNSAVENGGAICNYDGSLNISGATFIGNSAEYGGAICNYEGTANISGAIFSGNLAYSGGAIYNKGTAIVSGADFSGNDAGMGAAIYNHKKGTMDILGGNFKGNNATCGGAICNNRGAMTISGGNFEGNYAEYEGGALNNDGTLNVSGGTFEGNSAGRFGGAIFNDTGDMTISGGSFVGNSAGVFGGAIFSYDSATISGANFSGNIASSGGAITNVFGAMFVGGATFSGNRASVGGAIHNYSGTMTLKDVSTLTATDTIYNEGTMTFQGTISLAATVTTTEAITATGATVVFDLTGYESGLDTAIISDYGMILGGSYAISVAAEQGVGAYVLAGNASGFADQGVNLAIDGVLVDTQLKVESNPQYIDKTNKRLYALSIDDKGTVDTSDDALVLTVGIAGPDVTVTTADKWFKAGETVTVTGTVVDNSGEGIASLVVTGEGIDEDITASIADGTWSYTYDGGNTAGLEITITATDMGDNTGSATYTLKVDTVKPEIALDAETTKIQSSVAITITAQDGNSVTKLEYSTDDGETWTELDITAGASVEAVLTATKNHTTYLFRATDQAGNASEESITFDNIYDGVESPFEITGEKEIAEGAVLDFDILVMPGDCKLTNNGVVTVRKVLVSNTENIIKGNLVSSKEVELSEESELSISKDQFDAFMDASEFTSDAGKLVVSSSEGNDLRTRDIEAVMGKDNVRNVDFQEDLVSIKDLKIQGSKETTISFFDGYGTSKNDTIRFYQNTNITFGSEGGVIDLLEGNDLVQIDKNAKVTIKSGLVNVSTVKSAAGSYVKIGDISFQDDRSATLRAEGEYFQAGKIAGSAECANTITVGKGTEFASGEIVFGGRNDTITANKNSWTGVGTIQAISAEQSLFTGARIDFGAGNDQLNAGGALFATGAIDFGNGNDKLIVDDGGMFFAAESWLGDMANPEDAEYTAAELKFGEGNDILATGKHSLFGAGDVSGAETITLGEFSQTEVGDISGVRTLTIEGGSSKNGGAFLWAGNVTGTTENDLFDFDSYNTVELAGLDFGEGNDTLKLGTNTRVDIIGALDFGEGADKLSLGKGAVLSVAEFNVDSLDAGKLSMGKDAYLVISDADDLAAAQEKWSKYSNQIVSQLA